MTNPPCPHCASLREEITYLRTLLADREVEDRDLSLAHLGLTPNERAMVLYLFSIRGRVAAYYDIAERIGSKAANPQTLCAVLTHRIKKILGPEAIENIWGHGYRLTPLGQARLSEAFA